ncbi:MAG: response regulator transcription factor [Planctomycetes bacterium]|nr:response regulator transcription factor [Planctomycetota bacterium]
MRLPIVDDDPKPHAFVSKGLEARGHTTSAAGSRLEARSLRARQDVAPDPMLLDEMMPGGSGPSFLEDLRRRGIETPVIFVSAARRRARPLYYGVGGVSRGAAPGSAVKPAARGSGSIAERATI